MEMSHTHYTNSWAGRHLVHISRVHATSWNECILLVYIQHYYLYMLVNHKTGLYMEPCKLAIKLAIMAAMVGKVTQKW